MDLPPWLQVAIVIGVAGAGGYCFLKGAFRLLRPNPELLWREVPGQVISSTVDDSGKVSSARIRYVYKVDGDQFESKKITPIEIWSSFSTSADDFVRKYPVGRGVTVFVDPRSRNRSVLEPQQQPVAAVCLLLISIFFVVFAWLWWIHFKESVA